MSASQSHIVEQPVCHAAHGLGLQKTRAGIERQGASSDLPWTVLFGFLGALGLAALYLGIVTLVESRAHARDLFREDALFVVPIVLGFGTQVGLFTHLKRVLRPANGTGPTGDAVPSIAGARRKRMRLYYLLVLVGALVFYAAGLFSYPLLFRASANVPIGNRITCR